MKFKYNFVLNDVAGETIGVAVGEDLEKFGGFVKMNKSGAFIFGLLKKDITRDEIIEKMQKEYPDTDKDTLQKATDSFIKYLENMDVLE